MINQRRYLSFPKSSKGTTVLVFRNVSQPFKSLTLSSETESVTLDGTSKYPNGPKWTQMNPNGPKWNPNGPKWKSNGPKWKSNRPKWKSNGNINISY